MTVALFVQALFAGLTNGFVYALVGLGIAVIFKGSRTVNVVQGEFVIIGALIVVGLLGAAGVPYPLAALGGIAGGLLLGGAMEVVFIRPLIRRKADEEALLLVSIGLAVALSAAVPVLLKKFNWIVPLVEVELVVYVPIRLPIRGRLVGSSDGQRNVLIFTRAIVLVAARPVQIGPPWSTFRFASIPR